jgi:hypothetical protein
MPSPRLLLTLWTRIARLFSTFGVVTGVQYMSQPFDRVREKVIADNEDEEMCWAESL